MSLKRAIAILLALAMSVSISATSQASTQFITVSGQLTAPAGFEILNSSVSYQDDYSESVDYRADIASDGSYSLVVPAGLQANLRFSTYLTKSDKPDPNIGDISASWSREFIFSQDQTVNFTIPTPTLHQASIVDASNNPVTTSVLNVYAPAAAVVDSGGGIWQSSQSIGHLFIDDQEGAWFDGEFYRLTNPIQFYVLPTSSSDWGYFSWRTPGSSPQSQRVMLGDSSNYKLCLPINFGASNTLPGDCFGDNPLQFITVSGQLTAPAGF